MNIFNLLSHHRVVRSFCSSFSLTHSYFSPSPKQDPKFQTFVSVVTPNPVSMGKILVEICLISARGLRVGIGIGSSLLKHQWYAVGWLDPEDKYCTTIDASRSDNPVWRTKFATLLDDSAIQDSKSVLHVEVYCREPLFLRKRLHGSATVSLKEFLTKYKQQQSSSKAVIEETGSYQLRKTNSSKPQGFVDVSIRISAEREDFGGFTGNVSKS